MGHPPDAHDEPATVLAPDPATALSAAFRVSVVAGPDAGLAVLVDRSQPAPVLVGQSPVCGLRLADPHVSRRHAALEPSPKGLRLTDLNSTNGTLVNGVAVAEAFLRGGEDVRLGTTTLAVERLALASPDPPAASRFGRVIGASAAMRRLYPLCERLARADVPVVIEGETGTGKEVMAEALHEQGPRAGRPFVVFDCTAVPPSLVESALFGHEKGSFTGAVSARKGVFEQAHGGTLLIDEIGDLEPALQPKLLRALERAEVQRVGGERYVKVDVRVLAATRRDLDREVAAGRFRDDLFYRLAVARVELPPLRRRYGDIGLLARYFWGALGGGTQPLPFDLFKRYEDLPWPGNVRELHNAVARRLALGDLAGDPPAPPPPVAIEPAPSAMPNELDALLALDLTLGEARRRLVDDFERRYVERALGRHEGNAAKAAAAAGVTVRYLNMLRARRPPG